MLHRQLQLAHLVDDIAVIADVGVGADGAQCPAVGVTLDDHALVKDPFPAAVLATHPVFVTVNVGSSVQMVNKCRLAAFQIVRVEQGGPSGEAVADFVLGVTERGLRLLRYEQLAGLCAPVPDAVAGRIERQNPAPFAGAKGCAVALTADGNGRRLCQRLDQSGQPRRHRARLPAIDGKGAEDATVGIENRRRPAGGQSVAERKFLVIGPQRVVGNVIHIHGLAACSGRAAGADAFADDDTIDSPVVFLRQAGCRTVPELGSVRVDQQDGGAHLVELLLHEMHQ